MTTPRNNLATFEFDDGVPLSRAKLIRDTITGQWLNPKAGAPELKTVADCYSYCTRLGNGWEMTLGVPEKVEKKRDRNRLGSRMQELVEKFKSGVATVAEELEIMNSSAAKSALGMKDLQKELEKSLKAEGEKRRKR